MTATTDLVSWAWGLTLDDVPRSARHAAERHLLDGVGTILAAARLGYADVALAGAEALGAGDVATILGTGRRATAAGAALANGILVHALDFDDTHPDALVHATAAVLPTLFAVGEEVEASGTELLLAAIAGYETVIRIGAAVRHGFHRRGFHATSVCGVFAAALVASRLLGLDREAAVDALGIAGSQAAGSLEFLDTGDATKQLHPGLAGQAGVVAARLAAAGATGPDSILEGDRGLFAAYADATVEPQDLTRGLGTEWEVTRVIIKPYPVCQLSHASLDALRAVRSELPDVDAVEQMVFDIPRDAVPIVCEPAHVKVAPRNVYDARFSLPWCAATLLLEADLTLDHLASEHLEDAATLYLAKRVGYEAIDPGVPAADAPGNVRVRLRDGRELHGRVGASRGGAVHPLTDEELVDKFVVNRGSGDPTRDRDLASTILHLADQPTLASIAHELGQELT